MLDNFDHLKVLWNYVGVEEGLEILQKGGSDFSSTNLEEKIITMAGGKKIRMDRITMESLIQSIGRTPCMTHSGDL